jgi:CheY-like chemotaxis protein
MHQPLIVIAEDDADDQFLFQTAFEENGLKLQIKFVNNGVEMISYLDACTAAKDPSNIPSLIILDLNMPKKDGREVLKEIKTHPVYKIIPVIIFTTTKNEKEVRRCYDLGANSYIVKPVTFDGLVLIIREIKNFWFNTVVLP